MSEQRPKVLATRKFPADIEGAPSGRVPRHAERDRPDLSARGAGGRSPRARRGHVLPVGALQPRGAGAGGGLPAHHRDLLGRIRAHRRPRRPSTSESWSRTPRTSLTDATADTAMLCILAAARRAAECDRFVRSGGWDRWHTLLMLGTHVTGKRPRDPRHGADRSSPRQAGAGDSTCRSTTTTAAGFPRSKSTGRPFHADPADLLAVSDFLSINCPSSPETVRLLNAERIEMLPEGAFVVNTARGNIVDDEALIAALRCGRVAGAGLDVSTTSRT